MLIYKNDGTPHSISNQALKLAGYNDILQFLDEHKDFSELFLKRSGYIYNFENFSWISFLKNASNDQKKALIAASNGAVYACQLTIEKLFPVVINETTPEFYYKIGFEQIEAVDIVVESQEDPLDLASAIALEKSEEADVSLISHGLADQEPLEVLDVAKMGIEDQDGIDAQESSLDAAQSVSQDKIEDALTKEGQAVDAPILIKEEALKELEDPPSIQAQRLDISEPHEQTLQPSGDTALVDEKAHASSQQEVAKAESKDKDLVDLADAEAIERAASFLGVSSKEVEAFIKEFIEDYYKGSDEIHAAIEAQQLHVVKKRALQMKGVAANLMLKSIVAILEELIEAKTPQRAEEVRQTLDRSMQILAERFDPEYVAQRPKDIVTIPSSAPGLRIAQGPEEEVVASLASGHPVAGEVMEEKREEVAQKPISFDPAEAANALGLPESLIVDFVKEFIAQALEEKKTFVEAFEKDDIETINKTAHKLKGVAANLRIEEAKELLQKAQYAKSVEEAKEPLKRLYAKLKELQALVQKGGA